MNSELKQTYKRILIGGEIGFLLLFMASFGLIYINGYFGPSIIPYFVSDRKLFFCNNSVG